MRTPLTYYGGKQKLARQIVALMPAHPFKVSIGRPVTLLPLNSSPDCWTSSAMAADRNPATAYDHPALRWRPLRATERPWCDVSRAEIREALDAARERLQQRPPAAIGQQMSFEERSA